MSFDASKSTEGAGVERLVVAYDSSSHSSSHGSQVATSGAIAEPITVINAIDMMAAGNAFITDSKTVEVRLDMEAVEANSVAIAVSLGWLGCAKRAGKELSLSHLSPALAGVIEFSGVTSMFENHIGGASSEGPQESSRD